MKTRILSFIFIIIGLVILSGCGTTPAPASAEKGTAFLWQLKKGETQLWCLGSLALVPADMYPLADTINNAYAGADKLVVELNTVDAANLEAIQQQTMQQGLFDATDNLSNHLTPELRDEVAALLVEMGASLEAYEVLKPWVMQAMVVAISQQKYGYDPLAGMDMHFINRAIADKKPVLELDTVQDQIEILAGIALADQVLALECSLADSKTIPADTPALIAAWKSGDTKQYAAIANKVFSQRPEFAAVYKRLYTDRNSKMVEKILNLTAENGKYFVVVNAGNLIGDDGIIALLRQKGFSAKQL